MEELLKEIEDISRQYNIVLSYTPIRAIYMFKKPEDIIKKEIISFCPIIVEFYNNNKDYKYITATVIREEIPIFYSIEKCLNYGLNHLRMYIKYHLNHENY